MLTRKRILIALLVFEVVVAACDLYLIWEDEGL